MGSLFSLPPGFRSGIGQVGQPQHQGVVRRLRLPELGVVGSDGLLELVHPGENGGGILPVFLHLGDLLGVPVLLGLGRLRGGDELPAFAVQGQDLVDGRVAVHLLVLEQGFDPLGVVSNHFDV
jgi:hypothetical protein